MAITRILREREVLQVTGLSRSTLHRKLKAKTFPMPVRLAPKTIGWREPDVASWIDALKPVTDLSSAA